MRSRTRLRLLVTLVILLCSACSPKPDAPPPAPTEVGEERPEAPDPTDTPTPTPTPAPVQAPPTATPEVVSACTGLSPSLDVQILVGPADAVGLEPVTVGTIPLSVEGTTSPHPVNGQTGTYYNETLTEEWGTYTVEFDADLDAAGTCVGTDGAATLDLEVTMSGSQLVEVRSEGFSGDYPWEGTNTLSITLPAEEGASAEGEGWVMVLHLN